MDNNPKIKKPSNLLEEEMGRMAPPRKRVPATASKTMLSKEFVVPATPLAGHKKHQRHYSTTAQQQPRVPETPCTVPETPQPPGMALVMARRPSSILPPPASLVVAEAFSSLAMQKA